MMKTMRMTKIIISLSQIRMRMKTLMVFLVRLFISFFFACDYSIFQLYFLTVIFFFKSVRNLHFEIYSCFYHNYVLLYCVITFKSMRILNIGFFNIFSYQTLLSLNYYKQRFTKFLFLFSYCSILQHTNSNISY